MKYVILSPYGIRTGGPEACYQLSDSLIRQGFEAEIWLVSDGDANSFRDAVKKKIRFAGNTLQIPERLNKVDEYKHYQSKPFKSFAPGDDVIFIMPEVYISIMPLFVGCKVIVWWLSVDNALRAMADINLNMLRTPWVKHAVQSDYARAFTASLGLKSTFLTDYTVISPKPTPALQDRPFKVSVNAGEKVIFDLNFLSALLKELCPAVEIVKISGLSREEVYDAFSTSRVFIDLGNFPGKDRMAREALLLGANIIVGNAGAGHYEADYPLPALYRPQVYDLGAVAQLASKMVHDPLTHAMQFKSARQIFGNEKESFDKEVMHTFSG